MLNFLRAELGPTRSRLGTRPRCPGRPDPDDDEHQAAGAAAVALLGAILAGYGISGDDAIHAIRSLRVVLHGFVSLERAGGFGLPQSVDETFSRLIDTFDLAFAGSPPRAGERGLATLRRSASATGTPERAPT